MRPDYDDIKEATGNRTPLWYDGNGVPRYAPFEPDMLGIYDSYALLVEIECQSCRQRFLVGEGWQKFTVLFANDQTQVITHTLRDLAEKYTYGDPPRHGGCVGETMSSDERRIVEAWHKTHETEERDGMTVITKWNDWARDPGVEALEIDSA